MQVHSYFADFPAKDFTPHEPHFHVTFFARPRVTGNTKFDYSAFVVSFHSTRSDARVRFDGGYASSATYLFLPHFDVICDLLMNRRTATWNLFVKYKLSIQSGIDPLADNCNSSYCGCTVLSKPSFFINQHVGVLHVYSGNRTQT